MLWDELNIDINTVPIEQLRIYTAVEYFLCHQSIPPKEAAPLRQVQHYLESFHHLCEVEDWRRATLILTVIPDSRTDEELHDQLGIWGYYDEQEKLYECLLGKMNPACDAVCYNGLGNIHDARGELNESETYHQKHLEFAQKSGDTPGEWKALMGLGNVAKNRGQWQQAATYYKQGLEVIENNPDADSPQGRAMLMGNLANVLSQDNPQESLYLATAALEMFRNLGNPSLIALALVLVGDIYNLLKQPKRALQFHHEGWEIAQSSRQVVAEIDAMKGIAEAYFEMDDSHTAQTWYQKCYRKAQSIKERSLQCQALRGLGMAAYDLGSYEESKDHFQTYLELASSMGDEAGILAAMKGLSYVWDALNEIEPAAI